jgi:hypothetical protein
VLRSVPEEALRTKPQLTRNQVRSFWAAWGGWTMDGMDSFIYSLVLVPALRDLLPRSGIPATTANVGYYGGLLFALFMIGWGVALIWGPIADRFGRVRTVIPEQYGTECRASAFAFTTKHRALRRGCFQVSGRRGGSPFSNSGHAGSSDRFRFPRGTFAFAFRRRDQGPAFTCLKYSNEERPEISCAGNKASIQPSSLKYNAGCVRG